MLSGSAAARWMRAFVVPWHVATPPTTMAPSPSYTPTSTPPASMSGTEAESAPANTSTEPPVPHTREQAANVLASSARARGPRGRANKASTAALVRSETARGPIWNGAPALVNSNGLKGTMSNHDQKKDETSKATGEMLPTNLSSIAFMPRL